MTEESYRCCRCDGSVAKARWPVRCGGESGGVKADDVWEKEEEGAHAECIKCDAQSDHDERYRNDQRYPEPEEERIPRGSGAVVGSLYGIQQGRVGHDAVRQRGWDLVRIWRRPSVYLHTALGEAHALRLEAECGNGDGVLFPRDEERARRTSGSASG